MSTPMVFQASLWDEGDYVVSLRPESAKAWEDCPIGCTLSRRDAEVIAKWLPTAWADIRKLSSNLEKIEAAL